MPTMAVAMMMVPVTVMMRKVRPMMVVPTEDNHGRRVDRGGTIHHRGRRAVDRCRSDVNGSRSHTHGWSNV